VRRVAAPAGGGGDAPAPHPGLAPWSAEFRRRYPSWQVGTRRALCQAAPRSYLRLPVAARLLTHSGSLLQPGC